MKGNLSRLCCVNFSLKSNGSNFRERERRKEKVFDEVILFKSSSDHKRERERERKRGREGENGS